jgi:hypothetical protein
MEFSRREVRSLYQFEDKPTVDGSGEYLEHNLQEGNGSTVL